MSKPNTAAIPQTAQTLCPCSSVFVLKVGIISPSQMLVLVQVLHGLGCKVAHEVAVTAAGSAAIQLCRLFGPDKCCQLLWCSSGQALQHRHFYHTGCKCSLLIAFRCTGSIWAVAAWILRHVCLFCTECAVLLACGILLLCLGSFCAV